MVNTFLTFTIFSRVLRLMDKQLGMHSHSLLKHWAILLIAGSAIRTCCDQIYCECHASTS
jgi:hypothetical protein